LQEFMLKSHTELLPSQAKVTKLSRPKVACLGPLSLVLSGTKTIHIHFT
jgi:hypothetical protein